MSNLLSKIKESTKFVSNNSKYVRINYENPSTGGGRPRLRGAPGYPCGLHAGCRRHASGREEGQCAGEVRRSSHAERPSS